MSNVMDVPGKQTGTSARPARLALQSALKRGANNNRS